MNEKDAAKAIASPAPPSLTDSGYARRHIGAHSASGSAESSTSKSQPAKQRSAAVGRDTDAYSIGYMP